MLDESLLEMPYCQQNFGENKIEMLPCLGELGPNFHIWAFWSKIEKPT